MANSLLITALGIVLVATICNCLEFSYDYLKRPERYFSTADSMKNVEVLRRFEVRDGADYEEVIETLRKLQKSLDRRGDERYIETWLELAKPGGDCINGLPNLFLNLYDNLSESTILKQKQLLLDTLTHYGTIRFKSCAAKALEAIESAKNEKEFVEAERFFKRVLNLDENVSDRDFYRKLRALSVSDADWNVGLLLSEAHDYDKEDPDNYSYIENKYHFLFVDNCRSFEDYMTQPLEIIILAKDMNPDTNYFKGNDKLRRLNELKRVCMDFWRHKHEFIANLAKKISLKSRVLVPLKNKLGI